MMYRPLLLALLAFCCFSGTARAAMFCIDIPGITPQCIYDDPAACRVRAADLGGICTLNPQEAAVAPGYGYGTFCMVDASRSSQCVYADRDSCEKDAQRNRSSVCVQNSQFSNSADPFRNVQRRSY